MPKFFPMTMIRGCSALKTLNKLSYSLISLALSSTFFFSPCFAQSSHPVRSVTFSIDSFDEKIEENIRKTLELNNIEHTKVLDKAQLNALAEQGKSDIQKALHPFGYYHAHSSLDISLDKENNWHIHYDIVIGNPIIVTDINIVTMGDGRKNSELLKALSQFPIKRHGVLNQENYTQGKDALLGAAIHEGYLDAYFPKHEILVDLDENKATVDLVLNTLDVYKVGSMHFSSSNLNDDFLKRFAKFYEYEPYIPEKILAFQRALQQSDYFKSVQVEPNPNSDNHLVPLDVNLSPLKPNKYTVGLGYGTDTGPRGTLGWERRYLNEWGHRLILNLRAGQKNHTADLNASYLIPGKSPITDNYQFKTGLHNEDYLSFNSKVQEFGIIENKELGKWSRVLSLSYRRENFQEYILGTNRVENLFLPSVQFIKVVSDNLFSPTEGYRLAFNLKASIESLLSDVTFFQPRIDYKYLKKLSPNTKFIFRTELGMTVPDDIDKIPLSQRFYAGGDQSLRGFGYRALPGTVDKDGQPRAIGGGYLAIGSLELDQKIYGPVSLAVFTDAGNAFHRSNDRVQASVGAGARINTPIGPIKIDFAVPVTDYQHHVRVHIQIGPEI